MKIQGIDRNYEVVGDEFHNIILDVISEDIDSMQKQWAELSIYVSIRGTKKREME